MNPDTHLYRQVNPNWITPEGRVSSLAFWPFPKDSGLLSVYDGSMINAEGAYRHFTDGQGFLSSGSWAITVAEAHANGVPARSDAVPYPEHAVVDFSLHSDKDKKKISKVLAAIADTRGCLYAP